MIEKPQPEEQIEYHCPVCKSITVIVLGVHCCKGCGRALRIIQVDEDRFRDFGEN